MEEEIGVKVIIKGFVQGVGFRFFAVRIARDYGIKGYVRNLSDGNVEVVGKGTKENISLFLDALKQGPQEGLVRDVEIYWNFPVKDYKDFHIAF